MKPKIILINGPLGAGKTTFLKNLIARPEFQLARIIENEFASTSVDTAQLHDHQAEVKTIAGVCICCSTGDDLTSALKKLADTNDPVIIEATGVTNSLKLIEKIALADMLELYEIAHAVFVLDVAEAVKNPIETLDIFRQELEAADTVLLSKRDLVEPLELELFLTRLKTLKIAQLDFIDEGVFDEKLLLKKSHILHFFAELDEEISARAEEQNFTIISTKDIAISEKNIGKVWNSLRQKFSLKRMKGDMNNLQNVSFHIQATPSQCRISAQERSQGQLVFIGEKAREVTPKIFEDEVKKYE